MFLLPQSRGDFEIYDYVSLQDVGFGISQILPVYIESLRLTPGETLILEQPEMPLGKPIPRIC